MPRWIFYIPPVIALGIAIFFNFWIQAMACAFGNPSGACTFKMPWTYRGEDFILLILWPGIIILAIFGICHLLARRFGR